MFNLYFPQSRIRSQNVLYDYEVRQFGSSGTIPRLRAFTLVCMVCIHVGIWAYTLLALASGTFQATHILAFALTSTGVGFAADVYTFAVAFAYASRLAASNQLDLLRLTPISARDIVTARVITSQIRLWRIMIIEALMRLIIIEALMVLVVIYLPLYFDHGFTVWVLAPFLLPMMVFTVLLYHEPQWRLRMITTMAYYLGTTIQYTSLAFWAGIGVVIGSLALRALFMYGFYFVILRVIGPYTPFLWLPITPFAFFVKFVIETLYLSIETWTMNWAIDSLR